MFVSNEIMSRGGTHFGKALSQKGIKYSEGEAPIEIFKFFGPPTRVSEEHFEERREVDPPATDPQTDQQLTFKLQAC